MPEERELRLAVTMTGGVSLAIWMGGVATELIHLATALRDEESQSHQTYRSWLESPKGNQKTYKSVRLDVLSGTSAGGLNSALLGAALAWNVPAQDFTDRLRSTWLSVGSLQDLMRGPFESNQPSLLRGDDYFKPQVEDILTSWQGESPADPNPVHLIVTCTLLTPVEVQYVDESGRKIIEVDYRGWFEFKGDDFKEDIARKVARAARTSASYPVAFEASWLPVGEGGPSEDLRQHTELEYSRFAFDGGILANKPLDRSIKAIFEQPSNRPVERKLIYVVPVRGAGVSDEEEPNAAESPTIAQMLAKAAAIPLSQSLRDDLADLREHEKRMTVQQNNRKKWLVHLDQSTRDELTGRIWNHFKEQRRLSSVGATLSRAVRPSHSWRLRPEIINAVKAGRESADWHEGGDYEAILEADLWPWGLSALTYMAQVLLDVIREAADEQGDDTERAKMLRIAREKVHSVLSRVRVLRSVDDAFWRAALEGAPSESEPGTMWETWSLACYSNWPELPGGASLRTTGAGFDAARRALAAALNTAGDVLNRSLDSQVRARRFMGLLGASLTNVASMLVEEMGRDGRAPTLEAGINRLIQELGDEPMRLLTQLWIIQVATQPEGITLEQKVDLVLIHSDRVVELDGLDRSKASEKLAGLQLARFGGFYKASWRANDFLWGRLDAVQRIGEMLERDDEEIRELQEAVVSEEANHLSIAIAKSQRDGALVNSQAGTLKDAIDRGEDAAKILELNKIGSERIQEEVATDAFVSTSTQALAVATSALRGEQSGLGPLRALFGTVRSAIALPSYLLGQAVLSSTKTSSFLMALGFAFVVGLLAIELFVEGADIPRSLVLIAGGLAASFYVWLGVFDGVFSFLFGAGALAVVGVAVIARTVPENTVALGIALGIMALIVLGTAIRGADKAGESTQKAFLEVAVGGGVMFLAIAVIGWGMGENPMGLSVIAVIMLLAFAVWGRRAAESAADLLIAEVGAVEGRRQRKMAMFAPRVLAAWAVLAALAVFELSRVLSKIPWDPLQEALDTVDEHRALGVMVALVLPLVVGLLWRPGHSSFGPRVGSRR